jgi:hypothetical protein
MAYRRRRRNGEGINESEGSGGENARHRQSRGVASTKHRRHRRRKAAAAAANRKNSKWHGGVSIERNQWRKKSMALGGIWASTAWRRLYRLHGRQWHQRIGKNRRSKASAISAQHQSGA